MKEEINPPELALRFLSWFCPTELAEGIAGDLVEEFREDVQGKGQRMARWNFVIRTFQFFRPGILLRNKFKIQFMNTSMLNNYIKVAFRNLLRSKAYSAITIGGLAIGIACSLVIFLFVYGEWSYDKGFSKADRIYRIGISFFNIGQFANGPEKLLDVLPKEFAGIETATRIRKETLPIKIKDQTFTENSVYFADTAYFKMFDYNFIAGDKKNALSGPQDAIISRTNALKYFGKIDVIGEAIEAGKEKLQFTIAGVVDDLDFNTHLKSGLWLSNQSKITGSPIWSSAAFYNYVLLKENNTEADLWQALNSIFDNHVFPESGKPMGFKTLEDYRANDMAIKFYVHKLPDIYLKSKLNFEISPGGNESNIYIFSIVSFVILILASVNFINLTTARASRRAKEVGIRKTMGNLRSKLIGQFLLESLMTSGIAMIFAILLAEFFLRVFEYVTGAVLLDTIWRNPATVGMFFAFSFVVGILSGLYPAFYLTSFIPAKVLKGNFSIGGKGFRNFLVVFQFTVSILLITCAIVVQSQLQFMSKKDLGFDQNNVLTIDRIDLLKTKASTFRDELMRQQGVSRSSFHMGQPGSKRIMSFYTFQTPKMDHPVSISTYFGDDEYLPLSGMRLIKGRNLNKDLASDSSSVILNEAAVKALDLGSDPIGATVNDKQKIIGVVSDFHWESLRNTIAPLAIVLGKEKSELSFKLDPSTTSSFLKTAELKWKEMVPNEPFQYHFLDSNFGELVEKEAVFGKAVGFFTLLAIFISCLGLYGLSAFTAEQRTKEIGIRKVMGASSSTIVLMLNKQFAILVGIALLISIPLSVFIAQQWLNEFAYRIPLGIPVFVIAAVSSLAIAWLTVSYHSVKAALTNPADSLKYE
ncbi:ABC transporter permease [Cytophagales bacterium WSM2-2]|nr:ABC transporter permease [Cytophagales bacterium WSM2-2]